LAKAKIYNIENQQFSYNSENNSIYMGQHSEIIKLCKNLRGFKAHRLSLLCFDSKTDSTIPFIGDFKNQKSPSVEA